MLRQSPHSGSDMAVARLEQGRWLSHAAVLCRSDFGLYAVFDGHNGTAAAVHCREVFLRLLLEQLPPGLPPQQSDTEVCERRPSLSGAAHVWSPGVERGASMTRRDQIPPCKTASRPLAACSNTLAPVVRSHLCSGLERHCARCSLVMWSHRHPQHLRGGESASANGHCNRKKARAELPRRPLRRGGRTCSAPWRWRSRRRSTPSQRRASR